MQKKPVGLHATFVAIRVLHRFPYANTLSKLGFYFSRSVNGEGSYLKRETFVPTFLHFFFVWFFCGLRGSVDRRATPFTSIQKLSGSKNF